MIKRTLSTIVLWALVFAVVDVFGATGGIVLLAVLSTLAQYEFELLLEKAGLPPWRAVPLIVGFVLVIEAGLNLDGGKLLACLLAAAVIAGVLAGSRHAGAWRKLAGSIISLGYVPGLMSFYALMPRYFAPFTARGEGLGVVIWVIAAAKFTDVGGYVVGSLIGRHKLAPAISPGKTWEGVAGGLGFSALVSVLAVQFAPAWLPGWFTSATAALLALPIGAVAIVSDLSESVIKRRAGVKDSGRCIPGIGGALDLADSLLLTGPAAFFLLLATRS